MQEMFLGGMAVRSSSGLNSTMMGIRYGKGEKSEEEIVDKCPYILESTAFVEQNVNLI